MKQYFIEGLVTVAPGKGRSKRNPEILPITRTYWANSPEEALALAREDFRDAIWVEGPHLVQQSEELRMRQSGAPELFSPSPHKKPTQRSKKL